MSGEALPPTESCLHNLHRVGDGRQPRPEPVDVCRNALGVFHMLDCPLTVGLPCVYYEAAPQPHPTTGDLDLEAAREELQRDFLGWRYRRRVRWLTKPKNLVPVGIVVEATLEPEEVVPETLAMRVPPEAAVATTTPDAGAVSVTSSGEPSTTSIVPAAPSAPERYPGQRRSEERLAKKRARLAALDAAAAAKKAAQIAAVAKNVPADEGEDDGFGDDDEGGDDEFGGDLVEEAPVDTGPKTVEQVLAGLPDAPIIVNEPRRHGGQRGGGGGGGGRPGGGGGGGGPPRDGQPRRRRRRGRRGGGGSGGGPGGGPRPQGQRGGGPPRPSRPPQG